MISGRPNSKDDFGLILHTCLERIESGEESLESLTIQYPEAQDFLRPPLEAARWLHQRSKVFDPTPAFLMSSRCRLVSTVELESGQPVSSRITQLSSASPKIRKQEVLPSIVFLGVILILVFISIKSVGFWIGNSLAGDPLYRVKLAKEQLELAISFSNGRDAELGIQFVERRMVETQRMILSGRERYLPLVVLRLESEIHQTRRAILALADSDPLQSQKYALGLELMIGRQADKLRAISNFYPPESQKLIDRVIQITSDGAQFPTND